MSKVVKELRDFTRQIAQEGIILLENKKKLLPLVNKKIAIFGRMQLKHYYSGTGSGGKVNLTDIENMIHVFSKYPRIDINQSFVSIYQKWEKKHPFNIGDGSWASEPWSQEEFLINEKIISKHKREDEIALIILGRTAGEDKDNENKKGSYLLTNKEKQLILNIKRVYKDIVVILNTGNIIDMLFFKQQEIENIIYFWHAGQDGMYALADIIIGYISPSGKLPMTIADKITSYPKNRLDKKTQRLFYNEDIYVGYRYFETFNKDAVLYPFGYGLSYTYFSHTINDIKIDRQEIKISFTIKNEGAYHGKETVQIYLKHLDSKLGKPSLELVGIYKTKTLMSLEKETTEVIVDLLNFTSFDDTGIIRDNTELIEKGFYEIYLGTSIRDVSLIKSFNIKEHIYIDEDVFDMKPKISFKRLENSFVTTRKIKKSGEILTPLEKTNSFYTFNDLLENKISTETFVGSLTRKELTTIILGEGMYSDKVTSGTAGAIGGVTKELKKRKIPILCCADGPSGIRMDNGSFATSIPIGTMLSSTFNPGLVYELYRLLGIEMKNNHIDLLLAPGMNIQKNPLNGRNFEYFSEDPYLTSLFSVSTINGLKDSGTVGVLKHFALNNSESQRTKLDVYVSQRALYEIYLRAFKYAVNHGAFAIMSSYNKINGVYAASNGDLLTDILRKKWHFKGIVMTDWWAYLSDDNKYDTDLMIKAQNDLYMVVETPYTYKHSLEERLDKSLELLPYLEQSAVNIINFLVKYVKQRKKTIDLRKYQSSFLLSDINKNKNNYDLFEKKDDIIHAISHKKDMYHIYGLKRKIVKENKGNNQKYIKRYQIVTNTSGIISITLDFMNSDNHVSQNYTRIYINQILLTIEKNKAVINVEHKLKKGVYDLVIKSDQTIETIKIIKSLQ